MHRLRTTVPTSGGARRDARGAAVRSGDRDPIAHPHRARVRLQRRAVRRRRTHPRRRRTSGAGRCRRWRRCSRRCPGASTRACCSATWSATTPTRHRAWRAACRSAPAASAATTTRWWPASPATAISTRWRRRRHAVTGRCCRPRSWRGCALSRRVRSRPLPASSCAMAHRTMRTGIWYRIGHAHLPGACATVGSLAVHPNSRNTIPGRVTFSVDLRHPEEERLAAMKAALEAEAAAICAAGGLELHLEEIWHQSPLRFDRGCVAAVRRAATAQGLLPRDRLRCRARRLPPRGACPGGDDLHSVR